ncbi:unnamed protein product, partial [Coffea canephora]
FSFFISKLDRLKMQRYLEMFYFLNYRKLVSSLAPLLFNKLHTFQRCFMLIFGSYFVL